MYLRADVPNEMPDLTLFVGLQPLPHMAANNAVLQLHISAQSLPCE